VQRKLTLSEYIKRRNGASLGSSGSLRKMLYRSLGAGTFIGFWKYWNPLFGYALGRFVYAPLRRWIPSSFAFMLTFIVSGAIHDLVSTVLRGSATFLFVPWFFLLSVGALMGRALQMDFSNQSWPIRALVNTAYITTGLVLTLVIKFMFAIP
jgi:hypothetical protein